MGHWAKLVDPSRKVFEGEFAVSFYKDRIICRGICFHCQSRVEFARLMSKSQARQAETDEQYRKNLKEMMADILQDQHQCGLLYVDKDDMDEVFKGNA